MKKIIAVLVALVISLTLLAPAFAKDAVISETKIINEYQSIKELKQKTDSELKNQGYSDAEIKELRKLDYAAELKERAKLDNQILKNLGYTDDQIKKLKSFKGTEDEINALAATITFDAYHINFWYDTVNKRSYWKTGFSWSWSSKPIYLSTDVIGAGWTPTMSLLTAESYETVTYTPTTIPTPPAYTKKYSFALAGTNSAQAKHPLWDSYNLMWASKGSGYVKVTAGGEIKDMQMKIAYGHTQLSISNPSIAYPWGISFSWATGVNEEASKTFQYYY